MVETHHPYHAGLRGLKERTITHALKQLRPRFRVLTYGREIKHPGHDQRLTEAYLENKHIVYAWTHGSHYAVTYAAEAASDASRHINRDPRVKKKINGFLVTAARSMMTGQQGVVIRDLAEVFAEFVQDHKGEILLVDRPGEIAANAKKDNINLVKMRHRDRTKHIFVEGRVQPGRRVVERVIDEDGECVERKTKRRYGLGEIGEGNIVDPLAFATTLSALKEFAIIPASAENDHLVFDPDNRLPGAKALLAVFGLWSNRFVKIKLNMPITNERLEQDLGKMPDRKKDPEAFAKYAEKLNHYIQNEIAEVTAYEMRGKYHEPIVM